MPEPTTIRLSAKQVAELTRFRDHHPKPYVRERAAAILKVASGWSVRRVALHGLLRPRRPETVGDWIQRYLSEGPDGLEVAAGRGRKLDPTEGETRDPGDERGAGGRPSLASAGGRPAAGQTGAGGPPGGRDRLPLSGRSRGACCC